MTVRSITGYVAYCDYCKASIKTTDMIDRYLFIKDIREMGWDIPTGGYATRIKCPECKKIMEEKK